MPKLSKNCYYNKKGEKKTNCYVCNIPKKLVEQTRIKENDEIMIYTENDKIIIKRA